MLQVFVDLDNVPGEFHTETSAANVVENILKRSIPHYNPVVSSPLSIEDAGPALAELLRISIRHSLETQDVELADDAKEHYDTVLSVLNNV